MNLLAQQSLLLLKLQAGGLQSPLLVLKVVQKPITWRLGSQKQHCQEQQKEQKRLLAK
jgi:hypothetical protein